MKRSTAVIKFIEGYCRVPEGAHVGKPIKLLPFQKNFIKSIYDNPVGTEKAILSIGRKNGKTAIIACLLLAHLVGPEAKENSQIVSGAMSRDQASLVFNLACKIIRQSTELSEIIHVIPSGKRLIGKIMNTEYRALAADGATAQGLSPVLAILDEIGQVKGSQNDFIDAITTSQGAHEHPLLIAISTQAPTDADLLSIWIDDAKKSEDPHIVCHVYAAEQDADVLDKKAWKAANPALGKFRSERDLEKLATEASRMPSMENTFRNLNLNQRVSTVNSFVSADVWKSCGDSPKDFGNLEVYGGLDLSARTDLTSLQLIARDKDGIVSVQSYFWTPEVGLADRANKDRTPYDVWVRQGFMRTTRGASVNYDEVARDIAKITAGMNLKAIAFDRWRIDVFKKSCEDQGIDLPLTQWGQGFRDMSPAIDQLEADLLNGKICHGMNPPLTMCAHNAVITKDPAGNRKLDKHKANGRIDGMVALAMAEGVSVANKDEKLPTKEEMDDYFKNMVVL